MTRVQSRFAWNAASMASLRANRQRPRRGCPTLFLFSFLSFSHLSLSLLCGPNPLFSDSFPSLLSLVSLFASPAFAAHTKTGTLGGLAVVCEWPLCGITCELSDKALARRRHPARPICMSTWGIRASPLPSFEAPPRVGQAPSLRQPPKRSRPEPALPFIVYGWPPCAAIVLLLIVFLVGALCVSGGPTCI